jgi:hypothetical protein
MSFYILHPPKYPTILSLFLPIYMAFPDKRKKLITHDEVASVSLYIKQFYPSWNEPVGPM